LLLRRILDSGVCRRPSGLEGDRGEERNDSEPLNMWFTRGTIRRGQLEMARPGVLATSADDFVPVLHTGKVETI